MNFNNHFVAFVDMLTNERFRHGQSISEETWLSLFGVPTRIIGSVLQELNVLIKLFCGL